MADKQVKLPVMEELSTGAIIYFFKDGKPHAVLLTQNGARYKKATNDVDIGPSGGMEGNDPIASAMREIKEETGIAPDIDASFCEDLSYEFEAVSTRPGPMQGKRVHIKKTRRYYLAEIEKSDLLRIKLSPEHLRWDAPSIEDALQLPTLYEGQKELLRKVLQRLSTQA